MILPERGSGLRIRNIPSALAVAAIITGALAGPVRAQLPPPPPDPMAISVGAAWVIPMGNLSLQDWDDGRYATSGTAFTQRFSYAPLEALGFFIQASFPAFGVDAAAVRRDYELLFGTATAVTGGSNEITAWNLGLRWRQGRSWKKGFYAEGLVGWHRDRLELEIEGSSADTTFSWEPGWGVTAGWVFPLGPSFAVDMGLILHEFREEYFINRWIGLRLLAVMTFGGKR